MGSRAFRTPVRAGSPGADPGSICVRLLQAYHGGPLVGHVRDKSRRPWSDFPDRDQGRRGSRGCRRRVRLGLSRRGAVCPIMAPVICA